MTCQNEGGEGGFVLYTGDTPVPFLDAKVRTRRTLVLLRMSLLTLWVYLYVCIHRYVCVHVSWGSDVNLLFTVVLWSNMSIECATITGFLYRKEGGGTHLQCALYNRCSVLYDIVDIECSAAVMQ